MVRRFPWAGAAIGLLAGACGGGGSEPVLAELAAEGGAARADITYTIDGATTVLDDQSLPWAREVELEGSFSVELEVSVDDGQGGAWCIVRGITRRAIDAEGETGARCEVSGSMTGDTLTLESSTMPLGGLALETWLHPDGIVAATVPDRWELEEFDPIEFGVSVYIDVPGESLVRNLSLLAALLDPEADRDALRIEIDAHPEAPEFEEWRARFELDPPVRWSSFDVEPVMVCGYDGFRYRGPVDVSAEVVEVSVILVPVADSVVSVTTAPSDAAADTVETVIASVTFDEAEISALGARYG